MMNHDDQLKHLLRRVDIPADLPDQLRAIADADLDAPSADDTIGDVHLADGARGARPDPEIDSRPGRTFPVWPFAIAATVLLALALAPLLKLAQRWNQAETEIAADRGDITIPGDIAANIASDTESDDAPGNVVDNASENAVRATADKQTEFDRWLQATVETLGALQGQVELIQLERQKRELVNRISPSGLSGRELAALTLALSGEAAMELGVPRDRVAEDLDVVIEHFPLTRGGQLAQQMRDAMD